MPPIHLLLTLAASYIVINGHGAFELPATEDVEGFPGQDLQGALHGVEDLAVDEIPLQALCLQALSVPSTHLIRPILGFLGHELL